MKLGDCFTPEQLVTEIYRQCPNIQAPIPVEEIARAAGVAEIRPMSTQDVEGMLVADHGKSKGIIFYKDSSPLGRQRFTIGHELGHFLLLHHGSEQNCTASDIRFGTSPDSLKKLENEANQFSQQLLMPDALVSKAIGSSPVCLELLKSVSDNFEMSFEAIANKCSSLSNTPFALIYSKDGNVRYCWKDRHKFPYWVSLKAKDLMPASSQAVTLSQPAETISQSVEVDPTLWISPSSGRALPDRLIEQTYTQQDGYQVSMIRT